MQQNLIIAGVGGQGILTIARAISDAAVTCGLEVKQAEVHGMSQRGGAVQSHLRLADRPIHSDIIPAGRVDVLISAEPLESLRYAHALAPGGVAVVSSNATINIGNYPPIESVLDRVGALPVHVVVDADRLARAAGSTRSSNVVMLGAASVRLAVPFDAVDRAVASMFADKGEKVVEANRRALRLGRAAAAAYERGLERGGAPRAVRRWVESLNVEALEAVENPPAPSSDVLDEGGDLSGAEAHAVERLLEQIYESGRRRLHEHEVYQIVQLVGAISPPRHVFLSTDSTVSAEALELFPGERVVLKIVSPDVVHKSDAEGVVFCPRRHDTVVREIERLIGLHRSRGARVDGVLVVEFIERGGQGLGEELFVGVRTTREFGPVVAAGLGGVDTEFLAGAMRPGIAVAKAVATETSAEEFFELFRRTAAYQLIAGEVRGHRRLASDGELLRCFRAFIAIARRFCVDRGDAGPDVGELEVNPFAFRSQRLVPLDGRGRLATATQRPAARPAGSIQCMLEPRSIAVLGVSARQQNFGRIILDNILACGFDRERLRVIKPGVDDIGGVRCVPSVGSLPDVTDLLVIGAAADQLPAIIDECVASKKVRSTIVIPGGAGETEASREIPARVREALARGRAQGDPGLVVLGPNCLGVQSRPGRYDTFFIPEEKANKRRASPGRGVALLSQSGAFIVSRMSNLETIDPLFTVSLGNQVDLTIADMTRAVGDRDDIHTLGVYVEGFNDLDGLDMLRAVRRISERGKMVVFYKAGRTEQGRDAASGHTASVAGDYDICEAGLSVAGALVADTFREFEQLLEIAAAFHDRAVGGTRLGAVTNAGFEAVGIADRLRGPHYEISLGVLDQSAASSIQKSLGAHGLGGLVNVRNPLDLTPMAGEGAYEDVCRAMLESPGVDALLVSAVPLTPALATTPAEFGSRDTLAEVMERLVAGTTKPICAVIDAGPLYEPLVRRVRDKGIPVFRSADQAVRSLGRYLWHRVRWQGHVEAEAGGSATKQSSRASEPAGSFG